MPGSGWNVVTTGNPTAAENFGPEQHLPKVERYKKASEFIDVVRRLWDSWDDDAFIRIENPGCSSIRTRCTSSIITANITTCEVR